MKLSSISIKNFKGIDEHGITVNIAPITLLFGPNNAGKSTVIQALHLAREVLYAQNPNFNKIDSLDIGTFKDYVHKHELDRSVSIKLEFNVDLREEFSYEEYDCGDVYDFINYLALEFELKWDESKSKPILTQYTIFINKKELTTVKISSVQSRKIAECEFFSFEHFVSEEKLEEIKDYVKNYTIDCLPIEYQGANIDNYSEFLGLKAIFDEKKTNKISEAKANQIMYALKVAENELDEFKKTEPKLERSLKKIKGNYDNIIRDIDKHEEYKKIEKDKTEFCDRQKGYRLDLIHLLREKKISNLSKNEINEKIAITRLNPYYITFIEHHILKQMPIIKANHNNLDNFIEFKTFFEKYNPDINKGYLDKQMKERLSKEHQRSISFGITSSHGMPWREYLRSEFDFPATCSFTTWLLTTLGNEFGFYLEKMLYMGPVRKQIERGAFTTQKITHKNWKDGSIVWDYIAMAGNKYLGLLNSKIKAIGLDYTIIQKRIFSLDSSLLNQDNTKLTKKELSFMFSSLEQHSDVIIKLKNTKTGVETEIKDMGLGISQIMPILGACVFAGEKAFIAIEEPESHIHPKLQVNLGDVIIESALHSENTPTFIIETHSEHLLLRFLRRIRHTQEGIASSEHAMTPNDIAVNWIGSTPTCYDVDSIQKTTYAAALGIDDDGSFNAPWPEGFFDERGQELFE